MLALDKVPEERHRCPLKGITVHQSSLVGATDDALEFQSRENCTPTEHMISLVGHQANHQRLNTKVDSG